MLDQLDRRIIARVCGDIGESLHPYRELAEELGISEDELLARLHSYKESGALRRFGAILRHQIAGFTANGMSIWNVPEEDVERVGELMTTFSEISHCYERPRLPDWPYNVFGMIHAQSEEECHEIARRVSEAIGISDYRILFSLREFKKSSMVYMSE